MTWLAAVPVGVVAAVWCVGPGLVLAHSAGMRGVATWASAPLFSIGLIATAAVVAGWLGIGWGVLPVLLLTVGSAVVLLIGRLLVAPLLPAQRYRTAIAFRTRRGLRRRVENDRTLPWRRTIDREGLDGVHSGIALLGGVGAAVALSWLTGVLGFGPVDALSSTYDAVHHYSAIAHILRTGDGSSLTLGVLTNPSRAVPYPAAWHDLVALVALTTGASIPVATNLVALAVAAIVWPLSCVLLVRQLVGRSGGALVVTPVVATAFTAFPWLLMSFGVLWPNLLGIALVPGGLAAIVTLAGLARQSTIGIRHSLLIGVVAIPALGFAHPNAAVTLVVLGLSPLWWSAGSLAVRRLFTRRLWQPVLALVGALAATAATIWFLAVSPFLASVRKFDWPAFTDTPGAVEDILWNAPNARSLLPLISVLVIVGAAFALRRAATGWLVTAHLTSAFLYVLAASREDALTAALTGAWYNDSYRLSAMVPITGVPLAAIGVLGLAGVALRLVSRLGRNGLPPWRRSLVTTPLVAAATILLILVSSGFRVGVHAFVVAGPYQRYAGTLLDPGQRRFLESLDSILPPDALVAANPFTGSPLLFPLAGRQVLFPHLAGNWTPEQQVIRERLREAATEPSVCVAVRATGLTHVIDAPVTFWPSDRRAGSYEGLAEIDRFPGFELIAEGGGSRLYRITACGQADRVAPAPPSTADGTQPYADGS